MAERIVQVVWGDAHQSGEEPLDMDTFHKPSICTSVGFVVRDDAEGITIAACRDDEHGFDRALFVPRGMVVSTKVLR